MIFLLKKKSSSIFSLKSLAFMPSMSVNTLHVTWYVLILPCTRKLIIKLQGAASRGELLREFILDAFHWTCPKIDSLAAVSSGPNRVLLGAPAIYPVSFMAEFNELPRIARFSQTQHFPPFQSRKIPRGNQLTT